MEIRYNVTGSERKRLADYIAGFLGCEKKYLGVPGCAYRVGYMEVSKNGTVSFDDRADSEEVKTLLEELEQEGFHTEPALPQDGEELPIEGETVPAGTAPQNESVGLTVEIPPDKVAVGNLTKLLDAKGNLIRKALGITDLRIEVLDDRVAFPWFVELPDADSVKAYTHFISALCEMSKNAKRVTATEKPVDNEKYAFRCFLLRLGFIGSAYKMERKILLKNLTGSSAFKNGGAGHAVSE